jgi:hypothetical protein
MAEVLLSVLFAVGIVAIICLFVRWVAFGACPDCGGTWSAHSVCCWRHDPLDEGEES